MPPTEVLVVGEAVVDVVRDPEGGPARRHPGGSPANVAFGLGRLGRTVRLVTSLGEDDDAELLRRHLAGVGVDVRASTTGTGRTSTAQATLDSDGAATYTFDIDWRLAPDEADDGVRPGVVHTGSIAALLDPGAATVAALVERHRNHAAITFDPNLRPDILGPAAGVRPRVERLVAAADVVKASDEDIGWLYPSTPPDQVVRRWATAGPSLVVITRGGDGSVAVHGTGVYPVPAVEADVVDTVGAGDAFMAGLIDGLCTRGAVGAAAQERIAGLGVDDVLGILRRAASVAAVTVSRPGADPPTAAELTPPP